MPASKTPAIGVLYEAAEDQAKAERRGYGPIPILCGPGSAKITAGQSMKKIMFVLLFVLSACTTERPAEDGDGSSSGPVVYGQLSVSVDHISVGE